MIRREDIPEHLAFTFEYALEDFGIGWCSWEEVEERLRQEAEYLEEFADYA